MSSLLIIVMIIVGIIFTGSVLMLSPKGGIGMGIGGMSGGNEYGSKKSLETKFKKIALISGIIFVFLVLIMPYIK